jgi:glycosyltransferase involved in cell wall biosynthesis
MGLVLAGARSPYSLEIAAQAESRGLDNVQVLHDISDSQKAWLLAHCEAFLFPSLTEGFGLPPLEAMHFGKPVFLSRLTSLPEVGGDAANYFDSFEPVAMRRTIEDGIARHERFALASRVAAHAASFSWARCTEQHVALYLGLLDRTGDALATAR